MMDAPYYREQAERARLWAANLPNHEDVRKGLLDIARDFDDIVADLESGAVDVRHPERMPQLRR
jgi:hypothetical protein